MSNKATESTFCESVMASMADEYSYRPHHGTFLRLAIELCSGAALLAFIVQGVGLYFGYIDSNPEMAVLLFAYALFVEFSLAIKIAFKTILIIAHSMSKLRHLSEDTKPDAVNPIVVLVMGIVVDVAFAALIFHTTFQIISKFL